jgi:hypothetical protein
MKRLLRVLVLSGAVAMLAAPVFADDGPGGSDPIPPCSNPAPASNGTTAAVIAILLGYLGL